jgi:hypothetical protein
MRTPKGTQMVFRAEGAAFGAATLILIAKEVFGFSLF